ncbi:MAG TPA: hypothetical protein VIT91_11380 [Chthoniobacterales bacterium]
MRLPIVLFFLTSVSTVLGQETDERMARILKPDLNSTSYIADKSFYDGKHDGRFSKDASTKPFYISKFFSSKTFEAKKYKNFGNYWTGEYVDTAKKAGTKGKYTVENTSTKVAVKDMPVKESRDAKKSQAVREYPYNHNIIFPGKSQKVLDQKSQDKEPLTVDQVRELLNKAP